MKHQIGRTAGEEGRGRDGEGHLAKKGGSVEKRKIRLERLGWNVKQEREMEKSGGEDK